MNPHRKVILLWIVMVVGLMASCSLSAQAKPFWKKLCFAVGFSYARCFPGNHLDKFREPVPDFTPSTYPLKLLEASVQYPIYTNTSIELGAGYAWFPAFNDARGIILPLFGWDSHVHASDFEISGGEGFVRWHAGEYLIFEGATYFCKAISQEIRAEYSDTSSSTAKRYCWGPTFGFGVQHPHFFNKHIRAYMKFRFGGAKEYRNDSIWDWDEKLYIGLSGLYMGIDFHFPGH
jgi:hypothetical protein